MSGRGIISDPKVVLLDEPPMDLSPLIIRDILNILDVIRTSIDTPIILVEQNVKVALKVSDRVEGSSVSSLVISNFFHL